MRKNSHEVIKVITLIIKRSVQRDRRYCQYNNEGANEIFPLSFQHSSVIANYCGSISYLFS
jgi:hypothetical protein